MNNYKRELRRKECSRHDTVIQCFYTYNKETITTGIWILTQEQIKEYLNLNFEDKLHYFDNLENLYNWIDEIEAKKGK